jgi:hypothetical protein
MPTPLSEAFVFCLKSDATAALAALTVIAGSHRGLLDWFSRTVCGDAPELQSGRQKPNGAARRGREANGHRKPRVMAAILISTGGGLSAIATTKVFSR